MKITSDGNRVVITGEDLSALDVLGGAGYRLLPCAMWGCAATKRIIIFPRCPRCRSGVCDDPRCTGGVKMLCREAPPEACGFTGVKARVPRGETIFTSDSSASAAPGVSPSLVFHALTARSEEGE